MSKFTGILVTDYPELDASNKSESERVKIDERMRNILLGHSKLPLNTDIAPEALTYDEYSRLVADKREKDARAAEDEREQIEQEQRAKARDAERKPVTDEQKAFAEAQKQKEAGTRIKEANASEPSAPSEGEIKAGEIELEPVPELQKAADSAAKKGKSK